MAQRTAPVTLNLVTIEALREGLAVVGIGWDPVPFDAMNPPRTNGLYAWATNQGAVIYLGVGERAGGNGLAVRLADEIKWAQSDNIHGHALAVTRLGGQGVKVVPHGGDIVALEAFDDSWIKNAIWSDKRKESALSYVNDMREPSYRKVEQFSIRLSMHLGDVGAPVNSQHKSAWGISKGPGSAADNAAEIVAARLGGHI